MLFNSYIFILLFLPLCIGGYYIFNHFKKYFLGQLFLLGMSLWFYGYFNVSYLFIMLASVIINYIVYMMLNKLKKTIPRKLVLIMGILINLGMLIYFKYMDFFITNTNSIFHTQFNTLNIVLPLGISFFTFQQLSFVIDAYRREVPKYNFINYACFVTFFPQLVAGPIVTHDELVPQFADIKKKSINWENLTKGIYIFALGLAKKVLLADTFGNAVNWGYNHLTILDTTNSIIVVLAYTFQIYFDFSGYCDMAIGIGKMLNIDLPINFNSPYKALTITEFWSRWHMTLTRFFTKYIYIPLGGNRKGTNRTYINILIVFLLSGFWHGANWTFVFWGACHGIFSVITRKFKNFFEKMHPVLSWTITFIFINIMWIFFRVESFSKALSVLKKIAILDFGKINTDLLSFFKLTELEFFIQKTFLENKLPYITLAAFFTIAFLLILGSENTYEKMEKFKTKTFNVCMIALLLVWCIFSFSGISTFLYFNF